MESGNLIGNSVQDSEKPLLRILQISDLHFGPPFLPDVAEALLRSAYQLDLDVVVVSGDLTQRAKREQFLAARDYLSRLLKVPQLIVPGNHDVPLYRLRERLIHPHKLYREIICNELNCTLKLPHAVIVGLDSTAPRSAITNGRINSWQLDFCRNAFRNLSTDVFRIVVAHHHFAPAPDSLRDVAMPRSRRAMQCFLESGVELILGGHLHRAYIGNSLDFYPGVNRERGIIIAQSGTSTSRRGRGREQEKNTFNVVEIFRQTIRISHYMYFKSLDGFVPNSRHEFRRYTATL